MSKDTFNEPGGARNAALFDAVDRHGPHPGTWPDLARAARAREAMRADRGFRAYRDGAVNLQRGLSAAGRDLDAMIANEKAVERITGAVFARLAPTPQHLYRRVAALAAVMVLSAAVGGMVDTFAPPFGGGETIEVVQLDTLVYGPSEGDY